jgi:hypothetical protein
MSQILIPSLVGATSAAAYVIISRGRQLTIDALFYALGVLIDWIGLFTLFLVANLGVGVVLILVIRGFTPRFVSLYELQSLPLLLLSGAQSFVFQQWRSRSTRNSQRTRHESCS